MAESSQVNLLGSTDMDKNVDLRTQFVVFGFIRHIQLLLIPPEIVTMILLYYGTFELTSTDFQFEFEQGYRYITSDADQLSRGHTQWINQTMHHPTENGTVITASDDWSIIFWRLHTAKGDDGRACNNNIPGEIELLPILKINTGLEVKAIAMSSDAQILACSLYDEEEDDCPREINLYFDKQQNWTFVDKKQNKRLREITRRRIILPFEPVQNCLCFSADDKFVFVAMYSSVRIVKELNEELVELVYSSTTKLYDHPVTLCCININSQKLNECEQIWTYLKDDEHISSIAISPNGTFIVIGTSVGHLIVTRVSNLTRDCADEKDAQKIWSSEMLNPNREDPLTGIIWNPNSDWIICGHASGYITMWKLMSSDKVNEQKNKNMFDCKWCLHETHSEAINTLSLRGSIMVTGGDDGCVMIHDMSETFMDGKVPNLIRKVNKIHGGRMVFSVCLRIMKNWYETVSLSQKYTQRNLSLPLNGYFMLTSGADCITHCVSLLDVCDI